MEKLYVILVIVAFIILGYILKRVQIYTLCNRLNFTESYRDKFIDFLNEYTENRNFNNEIYIYLTTKVNEMQIELGSDGIIANMIDPLKGVQCREYQALINFLPEVRSFKFWDGNTIMAERFNNSANCCDDMFLRHIGTLESSIKSISKTLINPFSCFTEGVKWVIWLPANILYWCGFINERTCSKFKYSFVTKLLTFVVTILGIVSSIMTIALGWDAFVQMLFKLFK